MRVCTRAAAMHAIERLRVDAVSRASLHTVLPSECPFRIARLSHSAILVTAIINPVRRQNCRALMQFAQECVTLPWGHHEAR
jgi:hypothetical protein